MLVPRLVGDKIGLHPVAVIFAVLAGGELFGFLGVLLALPIASVVMVVLRYVHQRYTQSELYDDACRIRLIVVAGERHAANVGRRRGLGRRAHAAGSATAAARDAMSRTTAAGAALACAPAFRKFRGRPQRHRAGPAAQRGAGDGRRLAVPGRRARQRSHAPADRGLRGGQRRRTQRAIPGAAHAARATRCRGFGGSDLLALDDLDAIAGDVPPSTPCSISTTAAAPNTRPCCSPPAPRRRSSASACPIWSRACPACTQVALKPLDEDARRDLLRERALARGIELDDGVLDWLFAREQARPRLAVRRARRVDRGLAGGASGASRCRSCARCSEPVATSSEPRPGRVGRASKLVVPAKEGNPTFGWPARCPGSPGRRVTFSRFPIPDSRFPLQATAPACRDCASVRRVVRRRDGPRASRAGTSAAA